jgi:Tol biopolymer transport system component
MNEARRYFFFSNYKSALPFVQQVYRTDTSNAYYNYLLGMCYYNLPLEKSQAISYLVKASRYVDPDIKEWSIKQKKAPFKAWYYMGKSYQSAYKFDKAIESYKKYNELSFFSDKVEVEQLIKSCESAKVLVKDSIEITIENMGRIINSEYDEHTPVISGDEKTLIFTSRRKGSTGNLLADNGSFFEDIYISTNENGKWTSPVSISPNVNTPGHEASISLSFSGNELYIYKDDFGIGNIYVSNKVGDEWQAPVKLGSNINTTSNETHATISPDGQTLIFTSDRAGGLGGKDLYYCNRLPNGDWGVALNMGSSINTSFDEEGPFFHPDGYTLFFSSQGHNSMGGFDLFYTELKEDGTWSEPANFGYPINSPEDELFYVISADGKRAYFSSIRDDSYGGKDLYILNLLSVPEKSSTVLKGIIKISGSEGIPSDLMISVKDLTNNKVVGKYKPNKETGVYTIILKQGRNYEFSCETEHCKFIPEIITVPEKSSFYQINKPLELNPLGMIEKSE